MSTIEKRLHKITPSWLDNLTTPLLTTLITGFVTFLFIGPIMRSAGDYLADGLSWMYNTLGFIGGGLFGLLYAPITMTGMHHSFIAVETQLIAAKATTGGSFIFPTASMNNMFTYSYGRISGNSSSSFSRSLDNVDYRKKITQNNS